ncbi:MAG TPA: HD domain-containing protein [Bacillales bacterium]|nr:HD domain-containing protein [Bacillales bacterium]
MSKNRFKKQLDFIIEIDKLKNIYRQTILIDGSRRENDAEHSWHLAMMVMLLSDHANERGLDLLHSMKMVLIHDLVEIDAGDTFAYDEKGYEDKDEREQKAADRLFGLLPEEQGREIYGLWREFEERTTPEARFAAALDRFQPLLHNYYTEGASWKKHGITSNQVLERNKQIAEGSKDLWAFAEDLIRDAVEKGYLEQE